MEVVAWSLNMAKKCTGGPASTMSLIPLPSAGLVMGNG